MSKIHFLTDKYAPQKIKDIFELPLSAYEKNIESFKWNNSLNFYKCFFNKQLIYNLKKMAENNDIPHIIFYGNNGVGKKTVVKLFLELIFGTSVYDLNNVEYEINGSNSSKKNKKKIIKQSEFHIIIEPNSNNFDKYLIQYVVKEYAKIKPICTYRENVNFKAVQINNLDTMTYYAQTSLRRTIEKYSKTCKFVMICNSLSKIIDPLKSRCLCIHIPNQTNDELYSWISHISLLENIKLNYDDINKILYESNGNLREILWKMDLFKYKHITLNSCDTAIINLVQKIFMKDNIQNIKNSIYDIYVTNLQSIDIINKILSLILKNIDNNDINKANNIINLASTYESRLLHCRREPIHIEAFVTNVMEAL